MQQDAGSTRRPGARLLCLEPLEDRQLLSGINPLGGSPTPPPPEPEMGVVSAAVPRSPPAADRQPTLVSFTDVSAPTAAPYRATNPTSTPSDNAAASPNDGTPDGEAGEPGASPSSEPAGGSAQQTNLATQETTYSPGAYSPASGSAAEAMAIPGTAATGKSAPYVQSQPSMADPTPGDDRGAASGAAEQSEDYSRHGGANQMSEASSYAVYGQQAQGAPPAEQVAAAVPARPPLSDHPASAAAQAEGRPLQPAVSSLLAEPAKEITDPVGVVRLQQSSGFGSVWFVSPLHRPAPEEIPSDGLVEDHREPARAPTSSDPAHLAPQLGRLLVGALPVHLTTLNRAVDEFFARLESLDEDGWALPVTERMAPWVVLALTATGAFEFARRRLGSSEPSAPSAAGGDLDWDLSTVLALLPPEDAP